MNTASMACLSSGGLRSRMMGGAAKTGGGGGRHGRVSRRGPRNPPNATRHSYQTSQQTNQLFPEVGEGVSHTDIARTGQKGEAGRQRPITTWW